MDTLAQIGFKADTSDLVKADKALSNLETTAGYLSTELAFAYIDNPILSTTAAIAAPAAIIGNAAPMPVIISPAAKRFPVNPKAVPT